MAGGPVATSSAAASSSSLEVEGLCSRAFRDFGAFLFTDNRAFLCCIIRASVYAIEVGVLGQWMGAFTELTRKAELALSVATTSSSSFVLTRFVGTILFAGVSHSAESACRESGRREMNDL